MRVAFRALLTTAAILTALLLIVLTTESGLQFAWNRLQPLLSPTLSIQSVHGRLTGPLRLEGLHYRDDSLQVTVRQVQLYWSPSQLLSGVLRVDRLSLDTARYEVVAQTAPDEDGGVRLPERLALPLDVKIDEFSVRQLAIRTDPTSDALLIDQGDLSAEYRRGRLRLTRLNIRAPAFVLEGSAGLKTFGSYELAATLNWRVLFKEYADLEAQAELSGSLDRLLLSQTLSAPYSSLWNVVLSDLLQKPQVEGTVAINDVQLDAIAGTLPPLTLRGPVTAKGAFTDLALSAQINSTSETFPEFDSGMSARLLTDAIELESLQFTSPAHDSRLDIQGRIGFSSNLPFDLSARWRDLSWPLQPPHALNSAGGDLTLSGNLDQYAVNAAFDLSLPAYTRADAKLVGSGDLQSLRLSAVTIDTLEGRLLGTADVAWEPDIRGSLALKGEALNPATLFSEWPGRLDLDVEARAALSADGPDLEIGNLEIAGTLRERPVHLAARGQYRPGNWSIANFALQSGQSAVQLRADVGESLDAEWTLDSPDLSALLPDAGGHIKGSGRLDGRRDSPQISATLSGGDLQYGENRVQGLALEGSVDLSGKARSTIDVKIGESHLNGVRLSSLDLRGAGTPERHELRLRADGAELRGDIQLSGGWQDDTWDFRLLEAQVGYLELAPWILEQASQGRITRVGAELSHSCWTSGTDARLCLQGDLSSDAGAGSFELRKLPFAYFESLLPAGTLLEGSLNAKGEFRQTPQQPFVATVHADAQSGSISPVDDAQEGSAGLAFSNARVNLEVRENASRLSASAALEDDGRLSVDASLTDKDRPLLEQTLSGEALVEIPDMAFVTRFIPGTSEARGRMLGAVQIRGSLRSPVLSGKLDVTDAGLVMDVPGVSLEDMRVSLQGNGTGDVTLELSARSGAGQLAIQGSSSLVAEPRTAQLSIRGKDVKTLNTSEAKVITSPDLTISLHGREINIDGEVHVPRARIRPRELSPTSVSVSADQIIVDETAEAPAEAGYRITSRVRFILGDRVDFDGFGLRGRLTGNVVTEDEPGRPSTASGELGIEDGRYRAYGQNLSIRTGRLLFAGGPLIEPGLDVEAVRRPAPGILVGIKARGSVRKPEFSLFSEPAMSQSDQLAWLILGRPIETGTTTQEQNTLNQTALMLGLAGGVAIGEQYGEKLGVDEISIESDPDATTNQASLLVGKYLSPKLFVSYGIGIFQPVSTLRLRYALGSRWRLVGETSSIRSAADLFYVIETGK